MIKISDALVDIFKKNSFLEMGISERIFNLTQLARFLQPLVESRIKKKVQVSALVMSISRLQKDFKKIDLVGESRVSIKNIDMYSSLSVLTLVKSYGVHDTVNDFFKLVRAQKGFLELSESGQEVSLVFPAEFLPRAEQAFISEKTKSVEKSVTALRIRLDERFASTPGVAQFILQKLYLQGVNIVKFSSTFSEVVLCLRSDDVKLAFETLHDGFFSSK